MDFSHKAVGKGIYTGNAHTMKTSGNLIAILTEFTTGVKHRKHDLQSRAMLLLVHTRRDTTSVIFHPDGIPWKNAYIDIRTEASHSLIYTVIHHLIDQVMQTSLGDVTYIHRRSLSNGLQAFEDLNTVRTVLFFSLFDFFCLYHFSQVFKYNILSLSKTSFKSRQI